MASLLDLSGLQYYTQKISNFPSIPSPAVPAPSGNLAFS